MRSLGKLRLLCLPAALASLALAPKADAFSVTYTGSGTDSADGDSLGAYASFTTSGNTLTITLENTGAKAIASSDVLTALYFTINGSPVLTPVSASLTAGSSYYNYGADPGAVGGNYEYLKKTMPDGAQEGISAAGLGTFGNGNFGGTSEPTGGIGFGLVDGVASNANSTIKNDTLINNGVTFTLTMPSNYTVTSVSNVGFQYGTTGDCEPVLTGVQSGSVADAGSTALALALGLGGLEFLRRKGRMRVAALS